MKNRKSSAKIASQSKILGSQAQKLKDKLENLKEQIRLKKQQKKMSTTATSLGSFNKEFKNKQSKQQRLNATQYTCRQDKELMEVLSELKIQNIASKLQEKYVRKLQQLLSINDEEIDKWKDIPIGYRIKLKKYIQKEKSKTSSKNLASADNQANKQRSNSIKGIEQIIKNRKAEQKYIPIVRNIEEQQQKQYVNQLQESEQQQMMRSIMQVLGGNNRKSCLKQPLVGNKFIKHVHWNKNVDQMEKRHVQTKYPKEKINKQIFHQIQFPAEITTKDELLNSLESIKIDKLQREYIDSPNYKYCWTCLKMLKQVKIFEQQRHFCGMKCLQSYSRQINPTQLFDQIVKTEVKYEEYKQNQNYKDDPQENTLSFDII